MTKKEAIAIFRAEILPEVIRTYGPKDKPAVSEAWNNWTDGLCKDREITLKQYETWSNPF